MSGYQVGDRVGAILSADAEEVHFLGYGIYAGEEVPPEGPGFLGMLHTLGRSNPKIILDDGKVVWGCECWWGSEVDIRRSIGDRRIIHADIEQERSDVGA